MGDLIKKVLFDGLEDATQIGSLFATVNDLPANIKNLLTKLLVEKAAQFKKSLSNDQSEQKFNSHPLIFIRRLQVYILILDMMPKLVDFDWRVDIKMASNLSSTDESAKSGQQTCILQLKVE